MDLDDSELPLKFRVHVPSFSTYVQSGVDPRPEQVQAFLTLLLQEVKQDEHGQFLAQNGHQKVRVVECETPQGAKRVQQRECSKADRCGASEPSEWCERTSVANDRVAP